MIIKNICKINIHPLFYLFALISIVTGLFKEFIIFTFIIITHELGHILAGIILNIYPETINILPFGGLTIFKMKINTSINKELFVALLGPILQVIVWFVVSLKYNNIIYDKYNFFILIFNLLPIYPLDGSKILNCLVSKFLSFKKSFFITMYISFITISVFIFFIFYQYFSFGWILILFFLCLKVIKEYKNFNNLFNKFLWERYNYFFYFKKEKTINSYSSMKRDYKHIFKIGNTFKSEREILRKRFDFTNKL